MEAAHRIAVGSGVAAFAVETALLCGTARLTAGDPDSAREVAAEAAHAADALGNRGRVAAAVLIGCVADRGTGASDVADRAYRALVAAAALTLRPLIVDALDVVAGVALEQGRPAVAARLHGATGGLRDEFGCRISPPVSPFRGDDERAVAQRLGARRRDAACAEGAGLGLEQAMSYATRSRGRRGRPAIGWGSVTPTEREVVAPAARGLRNRAIGQQLLITEGTVRTHLRSIFAKLGVTNRSQLAAEAARREP